MAKTNSGDSRKKNTLWSFLFLNVGFIISMINGIAIIPIYLHYINSSVYGYWLATGNILNWITIVDPGVSGVLLQRAAYAKGKNDKREIGLAVTSGITVSLILFLISVIVGLIFSFFITDIARVDDIYKHDIIASFRIAIWGTTLSLLANTFTGVCQAYQQSKILGIYRNGIFLLAIGLNIFLLFMGFGVYALAYTALFRGLATCLYTFIFSMTLIRRDNVRLQFDKTYFKSFSKIFSYTFFSRLFDTISSNIDLVLVSRYLGSHAVTVLDLSRRPLKIVSGLSNNVTLALLPSLPHLFGAGNVERIQVIVMRVWRLILWMSGLIVSGFVLFNFNITSNWVGEQFWIGNTNNIIMCVSFFLLSLGYNLSNVTHSMGDMKNNSLINLVRGAFYLVLLFIFSKFFGITGVLLAFLLPIFIMIWYYPRKVCTEARLSKHAVQQIVQETILVSGILIVCAIASYWLHTHMSLSGLVITGLMYALLFCAVLYAFSKPFRQEVKGLTTMIAEKFSKRKTKFSV
jgi:O-antigen/teichoic acid export membrane protein